MPRSLAIVAILTALLCAPLAVAAPATNSQRSVTIVLVMHPGDSTPSHFTLSGALTDSGVAVKRLTPVMSKFGIRGPATTKIELRGRDGTIKIAFLGPDAPADIDWAVVSATG